MYQRRGEKHWPGRARARSGAASGARAATLGILLAAALLLVVVFAARKRTGSAPPRREPARSVAPTASADSPKGENLTTAKYAPAVRSSPRKGNLAVPSMPDMISDATSSYESYRMRQLAYWKKEDDMLARMPKYEEKRDEHRARAQRLLSEKRIELTDRKAMLALWQEEMDAFWNAGALASAPAYERGYTSRALLELALERNRDDFDLLVALRDTLTSLAPMSSADSKPNLYAYDVLWPVVNRLKELVESGARPADFQCYDVMVDWTSFARKIGDQRKVTAAWQWLVDHAQEGGWASDIPILKRGVESTRAGDRYGFNIYIERMGNDPIDNIVRFQHGRALCSLRGSKYRREHIVRSTEVKNRRIGFMRSP